MKNALRKQKKLERLNHHPLQKKRKDAQIVKTLRNLPQTKKASTILFYVPIHGEADLTGLFELLKGRKKFVLPRVKNEKTLHLYYVDSLNDLEEGSFKIPEPKLHLKRARPSEIDLSLVPGVVFSRNCHRIGYGKGFYDRMLKKIKGPKIGIAYEFQIVENITAETHDTPMDIIVTEKEIIKKGHN